MIKRKLLIAMTTVALVFIPLGTAHANVNDTIFKSGVVHSLTKDEAARNGITGYKWSCLKSLITRENGESPNTWNPQKWNGGGSGAYGLPQALPGSKMASEGSDWAWNPQTQVRWMIKYSNGRYGGVCQADSYQRRHGYY